ncbi:pyridoxal phosphate phosphatase PHOSPHO2-like [Branchiostoma floridae]|nr:pyridoxal phosphate phosphatase PHOSPHO2-like [Branchiostoma floridae]XP_035689899.1 pyridoxal phosphate phosphatase PHOSPHO2-like [Branchiostoma floridae]
MATGTEKVLAVFDFDRTIIDCNSDDWVANSLCPGGEPPKELWQRYRSGLFMEALEDLLQILHDNGVSSQDILDVMTTAPYTAGMKDVLKFLGGNRDAFDCIVMSGTNELFLEAALKADGVDRSVIDKVYTNYGHIDDKGRMHVKSYHDRLCTCSVDICKGVLLPEYVKEQAQEGVTYTKVVYVGDGVNDLCPCKGLGPSDVVMPRKGYKLIEKIEELTPENKLKAEIIPWEHGSEVLAVLEGFL